MKRHPFLNQPLPLLSLSICELPLRSRLIEFEQCRIGFTKRDDRIRDEQTRTDGGDYGVFPHIGIRRSHSGVERNRCVDQAGAYNNDLGIGRLFLGKEREV
jgi:hypothetical protein